MCPNDAGGKTIYEFKTIENSAFVGGMLLIINLYKNKKSSYKGLLM